MLGSGVDKDGHRFFVPEPRALAEMSLAEIDAAVCWNYHLWEPHMEKDKRRLRAALGLPQGGIDVEP